MRGRTSWGARMREGALGGRQGSGDPGGILHSALGADTDPTLQMREHVGPELGSPAREPPLGQACGAGRLYRAPGSLPGRDSRWPAAAGTHQFLAPGAGRSAHRVENVVGVQGRFVVSSPPLGAARAGVLREVAPPPQVGPEGYRGL